MKKLGRHLLAEFTDCDSRILTDHELLQKILTDAARESGATIVQTVFHDYNPHGFSGVIVIAESHIAIHTWPEYGYIAADFFTCGDRVDPRKGCYYLKENLNCGAMFTREISRGIPSNKDEIIPFKPEESSSGREVA
ncbi:MAG: adenosylmethionine decarboxylase [candidate division Zixibacteria bacterium]